MNEVKAEGPVAGQAAGQVVGSVVGEDARIAQLVETLEREFRIPPSMAIDIVRKKIQRESAALATKKVNQISELDRNVSMKLKVLKVELRNDLTVARAGDETGVVKILSKQKLEIEPGKVYLFRNLLVGENALFYTIHSSHTLLNEDIPVKPPVKRMLLAEALTAKQEDRTCVSALGRRFRYVEMAGVVIDVVNGSGEGTGRLLFYDGVQTSTMYFSADEIEVPADTPYYAVVTAKVSVKNEKVFLRVKNIETVDEKRVTEWLQDVVKATENLMAQKRAEDLQKISQAVEAAKQRLSCFAGAPSGGDSE